MLRVYTKILLLSAAFLLLTHHPSADCVTLNCQHVYTEWWDAGHLYYCNIYKNSIFGARISIDSITGSHMSGRSNINTQGINFVSIPNLNFIPQNIESHFTNLEAIQIYDSNLNEILQSDVKPLSKLKYFYLYNTNLRVMQEDLFKYNTNLNIISVKNHQIMNIQPNIFDDLINLRLLDLSGTKCKVAFGKATSRSVVLNYIDRINNGECSNENIWQKYQDLKRVNEEAKLRIEELTSALNECSKKNQNSMLQIEENVNSNKIDVLLDNQRKFQINHENLQASLTKIEQSIDNICKF